MPCAITSSTTSFQESTSANKKKNVVKFLPALGGASSVILLFIGSFFWWFWQPLHVLERTQDRLQRQTERRNWGNVEALLADQYTDGWGHSRDGAIESASEVLRHFFFLRILQEGHGTITEKEDNRVLVARRLVLEGSGSAIAGMIVERVNGHRGQFLFTWERQPGWPPSWKLLSVCHENPAGPP
jgi:hypothetical protein